MVCGSCVAFADFSQPTTNVRANAELSAREPDLKRLKWVPLNLQKAVGIDSFPPNCTEIR